MYAPGLVDVVYGGGRFVAVGGLERNAPFVPWMSLRSGDVTQARLETCTAPNNEGFELVASGEIGRSYRLQAATALPATRWTNVLTFTLTQPTTNLLDTTASSYANRFYRLVTP